MSNTHYDVAKHFAKRIGAKDMRGSNVFTDYGNQRIFSYGLHFTMAVANDVTKVVVLNGDRYGVTTSRHQSEVRGALQTYLPKDYQTIVIPFTVLRAVGANPIDVIPVAIESDFDDATCESHNLRFDNYTQLMDHAHPYGYDDNGVKICKLHYFHRLGGSVFKVKVNHKFNYFLSGFDETHNGNTDGYFISLLPHPVKTIEEAFNSLKPLEVRKAIAAGLDVKRQGDAFAIPVADLKVRKMARTKAHLEDKFGNAYFDEEGNAYTYNQAFRGYNRPNREINWGHGKVGKVLEVPMFTNWPQGSRSHGATEVAVDRFERVYARGTMYHRPWNRNPEHKRISLGKIWHRIVRNTAVQSWQSTTGKVD